jgi:hypothetical protein
VRARSLFILALCCILVVVQGAGAHVHFSAHDGAASLPASALTLTTVTDSEADHLAGHIQHGDIDVDTPTQMSAGHLSLPLSMVILACIVSEILLSLSRGLLLASQPPLRPPSRRRWRYFTPLSHAPPFAA